MVVRPLRCRTSHDYARLTPDGPCLSAITQKSPIVGGHMTSLWPVLPPAIKSKVYHTTIARPLHDVACGLVRHSKIILRYPVILGIAARFLNITKTPKTSGDGPLMAATSQRRTITHDSSPITKIYPS